MRDITCIKFFRIGLTSKSAINVSFSFKLTGLIQICPSYQPDSSYSIFSEVNLLNIWFQPRYNLIHKRNGKDKLQKKLNRIYFDVKVSKYTLPEEITTNKRKVPSQNLSNINENDFFDFGQENILDLDNSINSFVGCWSIGTGLLYLLMEIIYGNFKLSPLLQKDSRS